MSSAMAQPVFANLLKQWRAHRKLSQLDLASLSGVSQRHISFLETGRANPSRPMVLALTTSLDVPLRERNSLLQSAGFASAFAEGDLDAESHALFREAIEQTLHHQEPYPALVLDGRWNMIMANDAALKFFGLFIDPFAALADIGNPSDFQLARLCLHDKGLAPYIDNWTEVMGMFLSRARQALIANPRDTRLPVLIEEIVDHPNAPEDWQKLWSAHPAPAISMAMTNPDGRYDTFNLFTMLAHFGAPGDITLEEVSVELFYPADEQTKQQLQALAMED